MKLFSLFIFLMVHVFIGLGQNLISNPSFENINMKTDCQDWFDGCKKEITYICDSQPMYCYVDVAEDSPYLPSDKWCLTIHAGFEMEGIAETYITGQSGTNIYQLNYWLTGGWYGSASIGTGAQDLFMATQTRTDTSSIWQKFSLLDTIKTQTADTITVRLSAGFGDFCLCTAYFDSVTLTITGTLSSTGDPGQPAQDLIKVFPNPSNKDVTFEISCTEYENHILSIYNSLGQCVNNMWSNETKITIDNSDLSNGVYFYLIQRATDKKNIGQGKFIRQ